MARKFTAPYRDRKPPARPAPDVAVAAAAALRHATEGSVAPPLEAAPATFVPEAGAAATEPAVAMTRVSTPSTVIAEPAVAAVAEPAASRTPLAGWGAMAQTSEAYLHAWLDCQREAAQFLDRQLEHGRRAQRRLSACDDVADAARIQRDWSTEALKVCLDEAACLPVLAAKFWTIGLSRLAGDDPAVALIKGSRQESPVPVP